MHTGVSIINYCESYLFDEVINYLKYIYCVAGVPGHAVAAGVPVEARRPGCGLRGALGSLRGFLVRRAAAAEPGLAEQGDQRQPRHPIGRLPAQRPARGGRAEGCSAITYIHTRTSDYCTIQTDCFEPLLVWLCVLSG